MEGLRLDRWLAIELEEDASRSRIQKWIKAGGLIGPIAHLKPSHPVQAGETYKIRIPDEPEISLEPVEIPFEVLFEDQNLAVIIKPPGIAVHPGPGQSKITLINGLLHRWKNLPETSGADRPGIVHRLDRLTEGLLIVARNENAHRRMASIFQERKIEKGYSAWLLSTPSHLEGRIELPIARNPVERHKMRVDDSGREAITEYQIEKFVPSRKGRKYSFANINILTGRTHQIRVHMAHSGAPVVGDPLYSRSSSEFEKYGMLLLARSLKFSHPFTEKPMEFEIDLPERFVKFGEVCENY